MEKYDAKFSTKWDFSFMESICIGKNLEGNISDINSDFLRKWELNYGWILLTLYIFCSSQVFHKDHLYIETKQKKNHVWETNSICGPKLFCWHSTHSPIGNLMYSRSIKY